MVETSWLGYQKFLPWGGFAQVADRPDHLSKLEVFSSSGNSDSKETLVLISHEYRFIFIHIYKTAGTSVMDMFLPYSRLIDRMAYEYRISRKIFGMIVHLMEWHDDGMKQFTGFHTHAKAYEVKEKLGSGIFGSYYKFTFVRNPFDLLVSLYFYISQDKSHRHHGEVINKSFLEFLRWHIASNPPRQLDFVTEPNSGKRLVDYIGRFETLEKDIAIVQGRLGLEIGGSIKHKNPSFKRKTKDYKEYYDEEGKNLVESYFRTDLDRFGYSFDGPNENIPIMQDP
jgi:hypothetical protein